MQTFIIVVGVILVALFLIVVVYPIVAKKLSPNLKSLNGRIDHKGARVSAEWSADKLNKVVEVTESESNQLPKVTRVPLDVSRISSEEELKDEIKRLKIQLLGTSTVALSTSADTLNHDRREYFKSIATQSYEDVKQIDPHSDLVNLTGPFLKLCENCKWGTKMSKYDDQFGEEIGYVGHDYVKCEKDHTKHYLPKSCDKWEPRPG